MTQADFENDLMGSLLHMATEHLSLLDSKCQFLEHKLSLLSCRLATLVTTISHARKDGIADTRESNTRDNSTHLGGLQLPSSNFELYGEEEQICVSQSGTGLHIKKVLDRLKMEIGREVRKMDALNEQFYGDSSLNRNGNLDGEGPLDPADSSVWLPPQLEGDYAELLNCLQEGFNQMRRSIEDSFFLPTQLEPTQPLDPQISFWLLAHKDSCLSATPKEEALKKKNDELEMRAQTLSNLFLHVCEVWADPSDNQDELADTLELYASCMGQTGSQKQRSESYLCAYRARCN